MSFTIGENCQIHPSAKINISNGHIGDRTIIRENVVIEGKDIFIGAESYFDRNSSVGGSSCFDKSAYLKTGDWFHLGINGHVNTSMGVDIGNESALGMDSKVFTHGSYIDSYKLGFRPQWGAVKIGDNAFLASVHINAGVTIGNNVVVSARSVINRNLPDNCFASGIPVKILKENYLPKNMTLKNKVNLINMVIDQTKNRHELQDISFEIIFEPEKEIATTCYGKKMAIFDLKNRTIFGDVDLVSNCFKDQLRRNGIRFRYKSVDKIWTTW